jgi:hypothetical protein
MLRDEIWLMSREDVCAHGFQKGSRFKSKIKAG